MPMEFRLNMVNLAMFKIVSTFNSVVDIEMWMTFYVTNKIVSNIDVFAFIKFWLY